MTEYRTIHNGHWEELQYLHKEIITFLWWKWESKTWKDVPTAYFNDIYGRLGEDRCYMNSLRHDIKGFVEKYPDITEYLEETYDKIQIDKNKMAEKNRIINENKGKITKL